MSVENRRRWIIPEDSNWSLKQVPFLSELCLHSIVTNIQVKPIYGELSPSEQKYIQETLSIHTPLSLTSKLIPDGAYWQKRCKELWHNCDASNHGQSWKRLFFERYLENLIELYIPNVTLLKSILDMLPLCKDLVKRLDIQELLVPIEKPEEQHMELNNIHNDDEICLDHFNFNALLGKLCNLEELHLVYRIKQCGMNYQKEMFQMTQKDCETLAQAVKSCNSLKVLHLYQSSVGDAQCRLLVKHLLDHPSLTKLDFSFNVIGDRGARAVAKLLTRSKLISLNLYFNQIQDHGAKALAHALSHGSTLEELNLGINRVGDEGAQAIVSALRNNSCLKTLNLSGAGAAGQTTAALCTLLLHNRTLSSINLCHSKLGADGGRALREAMSQNSTVVKFDLDLTGMEEEDTDSIQKVVRANEHAHKTTKQVNNVKQETSTP
ncbi:unnamed protein product [Knipowitschia caucasica]|uniref:T-complex-associated testis-expressed protein 1 n=1 Tax=Knipowitschia caucasica TaxID=637954 RepID=A0AAV2KA47_KNICA